MQRRNNAIAMLIVGALLVLGIGTANASTTPVVGLHFGPSGEPTVDVTFFKGNLAPYGRWAASPVYGEVFVPSVTTGWRPYTHGQWVYTDLGWTWISAEPFGWATDHYGRWVDDDALGWTWLPGTEWAPAYVSWQSNADYIGWAPLPPTVAFDPGLMLGPGGADISLDLAPASYVFVPVRSFLAPDIVRVALPYSQSAVIYPRTQNITRYRWVDRQLFDVGVPLRVVERFSTRRIPRYQLVTLNAPAPRPRITGSRLAFFRPVVTAPTSFRTAERLAIQSRRADSPVRLAVRRGVAAQAVVVQGREPAARMKGQAAERRALPKQHGLTRAKERIAANRQRNPVAAQRGLGRAQTVIARNQQRQAAARVQRGKSRSTRLHVHPARPPARIHSRGAIHAQRVHASRPPGRMQRAPGRAQRVHGKGAAQPPRLSARHGRMSGRGAARVRGAGRAHARPPHGRTPPQR